MALILDTDSDIGVTANYHKIEKIEWNVEDRKLLVLVNTYIDKDRRDNGAKPLSSKWVDIPSYSMSQDIRAWVYPLVKQYYGGFLEGAEDDAEPREFNPVIVDDGLSSRIVE